MGRVWGQKSCHQGLGLDSRLSCILKARESQWPVLIRGNADAIVEASWVWEVEGDHGGRVVTKKRETELRFLRFRDTVLQALSHGHQISIGLFIYHPLRLSSPLHAPQVRHLREHAHLRPRGAGVREKI